MSYFVNGFLYIPIEAHKLFLQASDYPVVLSLENHCSPEQQEIMADYLQSILGDRLLSSTLGDAVVTELPSPEVITLHFSL